MSKISKYSFPLQMLSSLNSGILTQRLTLKGCSVSVDVETKPIICTKIAYILLLVTSKAVN
jgi:hypothetical protein